MESFFVYSSMARGRRADVCLRVCKLRTVVKIRLSETFPSHGLSVFMTDLPVPKLVVNIVG